MKLKTLVAGIALAASSFGAFAGGALSFEYAEDGTKTAFVGATHPGTPASWTDKFFFTLLEPSFINGSLISIKLNKADWDFSSITLTNMTSGGSWDFVAEAGSTDSLEIYTLGETTIGSGDYSLTVMGSVTGSVGSYGGNINISPVPEPETYALMLAGLGAIGLVASRRRAQR